MKIHIVINKKHTAIQQYDDAAEKIESSLVEKIGISEHQYVITSDEIGDYNGGHFVVVSPGHFSFKPSPSLLLKAKQQAVEILNSSIAEFLEEKAKEEIKVIIGARL